MEYCECVVNRLMKALQEIASTMISNREANSHSMTDSGEQLSQFTTQDLSNAQGQVGGMSNLLAFGVLAMVLFSILLRFRERNQPNENTGGFTQVRSKKL